MNESTETMMKNLETVQNQAMEDLGDAFKALQASVDANGEEDEERMT